MFFKTSYSVQNDTTITRENLNKEKVNVKSIWKQKPLNEVVREISLLRRFLFSVCFQRSLLYDTAITRANLNKEKENVETILKTKIVGMPIMKVYSGAGTV